MRIACMRIAHSVQCERKWCRSREDETCTRPGKDCKYRSAHGLFDYGPCQAPPEVRFLLPSMIKAVHGRMRERRTYMSTLLVLPVAVKGQARRAVSVDITCPTGLARELRAVFWIH